MKLIYIAGLGHSGSTLLEGLLGNHPAVETCGELDALPNALRATSNTQKWCGCRVPIAECAFWSGVVRRSQLQLQSEPRINALRNEGGAGLSMQAQLPFLASAYVPFGAAGFRAAPSVEQYVSNNLRVLEAYLEECEAQGGPVPEWLVDSSKSPYRLSWLANDPRLQIHVLHIVRHPCEHARRTLAERGKAELHRAVREGVRWSVSHLYTQRVARAGRAIRSYQVVGYEELATQTVPTLRSLFAGMGIETTLTDEQLVAMGRLSHSVAGNAGTRFHSSGVKLRERWRTEVPNLYQRSVLAACSPAARAIGYAL
jgi:hypothetical protein